MKILAIERELPNGASDAFQPLLKSEAAQVWDLYQAGMIRELYFHAEDHTAVLVLECSNMTEANRLMSSLPLVQAGLIQFEMLPLVPYTGFARLFAQDE